MAETIKMLFWGLNVSCQTHETGTIWQIQLCSHQCGLFPNYFRQSCFDAVGWAAEGHPACKKPEWWDVGVVVWDEVQTCI